MKAKLGSLCQFINGGTPSKDVDAYFQGNIPWITSADITGPIAEVARSFITPEAVRNSATNQVRKGTVLLVTRTGVGKVAIAGCDLCFSQDITAILPSEQHLDAGYLVHFLTTQQSYFDRYARGATIKGITRDVVTNLDIPLPPLSEQRRIAAILDKADALRTKRREALAHLDRLAQSIFVEMFGDPATNPKGWPKRMLQEMCETPDDIKCGPFGTQLAKSEFTTEGVPLWGIRNVNAMFLRPTEEFVAERTAERLQSYSIRGGDIVMTRKGTVGNCAIYPCEFPDGIMHSDLLRLRTCSKKCTPEFLSHQLHHSKDVERQLALISGGAVMPGINVSRLKSLEVLCPPLEQQIRFDQSIERTEGLKRLQLEAMRELNGMFSSLQHRAFRGEL